MMSRDGHPLRTDRDLSHLLRPDPTLFKIGLDRACLVRAAQGVEPGHALPAATVWFELMNFSVVWYGHEDSKNWSS